MIFADKPIAVIQGAATPVVQALLREFAGRLGPAVRIAGVVEEPQNGDDQACGAGELRSLRDGSLFRMFQDLGADSAACRLDASGVLSACHAIERDIMAGCDLVVLNKFGKVEADRSGLAAAFSAAIAAGVPILTSVSPKFDAAWERFAASLYVVLPPNLAELDRWWRAQPAAKRIDA
jgi:hypothetical protein